MIKDEPGPYDRTLPKKINQPQADDIVHRAIANHCVRLASDPTSFVYVDEHGNPHDAYVVERFQRALRGQLYRHLRLAKSYQGITNDLGERAKTLLAKAFETHKIQKRTTKGPTK